MVSGFETMCKHRLAFSPEVRIIMEQSDHSYHLPDMRVK